MRRSFTLTALFFCAATLCVNTARAGDAATSSDFADAWNKGSSPITVGGVPTPEIGGMDGLMLENSLNPFTGRTMALSGKNNQPGASPGSNAVKLGSSSLVFAPGWDYGLAASLRNLVFYGGTNGAVSYTGNGTGAHTLDIDSVYFYGNSGGGSGGAVNVQTQMQSNNANAYTVTNSEFIYNTAANGGAVAMATNNSIFTSGANTFSVTGTLDGAGNPIHVFGMNKATAGHGGGIYFMGNNALGVRNEFSATNYGYFQNTASGLGGAIYNGVLNGNGPSANNFTITGNSFIENQAGSGGAMATTVNGGSTNVSVTLNGTIAYNIASANGGAVYNAVGDQFSPYGGTINFNLGGLYVANRAADGGAIYNDLRPGQATVTVDIPKESAVSDSTTGLPLPTMFANNTASGKGGAIYNTSGNNNPGTAVVNIADGVIFSGNTADSGGAIYNDGNGVIRLNTLRTGSGGGGILFSNNSASRAAKGADIYQASETAVINITGDGTGDPTPVTVTGGIAGVGTINQDPFGTLLVLGTSSQNFDFKGVYNLGNGSVLNAYGLMFGGANNIDGVANIYSSLNSVYFNANIGTGLLNYYSGSTERTSIGAATDSRSPGIRFTGSYAVANFTREGFNFREQPVPGVPHPDVGMPRALFTLTGKIDNGQFNTVAFHHGDVTFGSTDFTGSTDYQFLRNSVINLAGPLDPYQQYTFGSLTTNSYSPSSVGWPDASLLSLRVGNDKGSLLTDTINVQRSGDGSIGILDLGRVYINDSGAGVLSGRSQVIFSNALKFENNRSQYVSTSKGTYKVTTVDDQYIQFVADTTDSVLNPDGSTTTITDHTDEGGGATNTTTNTDGGATTTIKDGNGNTTTTTATPTGGATFEHTAGNGDKITVIVNPDGSGTVTVTPANGTPATTTPFAPSDGPQTIPTGDLGAEVTIDPTGGDTEVTFTDGKATASTVTVTVDQGGGDTTTETKVSDGSGNTSDTSITTKADGSGSELTTADGTTAKTEITGGTPTGTIPTPKTPMATLTLNDVNEVNGTAVGVGMSTTLPRGFQIGKGETYRNGDSLGNMAGGTFSVYGAADGDGEAILSGLKLNDDTTKQSLFTITGADPTTFRMENLTVQDALDSVKGGSVLYLDNPNADAMLNTLTVRNNESIGNDGGAVRIEDGSLLSTNVDYQGNKATDADGGALSNEGTGDTTVRGGSFTDNTADGNGGAINNTSTNEMTIDSGTSLTFTGNRAGVDGGAIYNGAGSKTTLNADSYATDDPADGAITFSDNTAGGRRNDIHNAGGEVVFTGAGGVITIEGGITGTGTLTKQGESTLVLGADADNSRFTGAFNQTKGITEVNGDFFGGTNTITGGNLSWNAGANKEDTAVLIVIDGGTITIAPGGTLRLANPTDLVDQPAATNLYGTLDLAGGTVYLSTQDQLVSPDGDVGTVNESDGYLVVGGTGMVVPGGVIRQTGGVVRVEKDATVVLDGTPDRGLLAGDLVISNSTVSTNGHAFDYGTGGGTLVRTTGTLAMGDDALMNSADGVVQTHAFSGKFGIFSGLNNGVGTPTANFSVDLNPQAFQSDMFVFDGGTATSGTLVNGHPNQTALGNIPAVTGGSVVLSGLNLINSPTVAVVPFTIMSSPNGFTGITFATAMNEVDTPIGMYSLSSLGEANYELRLLGFHPRAYRAQVATLAAVSAQSYQNNLLFEHVHLDSFDRAEDGRPAPWQFVREGMGFWAKPYFVRENLPFAGDVGTVDNDVYGVVLGMDLPALSLAGGWKFLPTVFAAYNGGRQEFPDVETIRDGGQAGFMGTFSNGTLAASVMGYAGGYRSAMSVPGHRDKPNNWFAGGAVKLVENIRATRNLLLQPYALAAYNVYGDQKWHSDYGSISMEAGGFHGWNVAPGFAMAYERDDWSVNASVHYMFSLDNAVRGKVGELDLLTTDTGGGYFEYGLGASKKINESLLFEGKATFRSGSGTESYGGHVGFSWQF